MMQRMLKRVLCVRVMWLIGSVSSRVSVEGDRSSWKQQALWLMEPTSHRDGLHAGLLSPLSSVVSPTSQSHSDKVINVQVRYDTIRYDTIR